MTLLFTLVFKLKELNLNGKFYDILYSQYNKSSVCVRVGEHHADLFVSKVGVRQGDVLSHNLFKIFINDLSSYLNDTLDPVLVKKNCLLAA